MDKKLIDYEGFKAYTKGVKEKYAEKKDIITPSERKYVQLSNDGFDLIEYTEAETLLSEYVLLICKEIAQHVYYNSGTVFDALTELSIDNNGDVEKIKKDKRYTDAGFVGLLQKDLLDSPQHLIKAQDGHTLTVDEIAVFWKQKKDGIFLWMRKEMIATLQSCYSENMSLNMVSKQFVKQEKGKGLSTNDYTDTDKLKVSAIPDNPKYTDTMPDLTPYAKKENMPTKLSQLENDKTFKTETEIQSMIEKASSLKKEVVTSLPQIGKDDVIYLVKDDKGKDNNNYLEYLWLNGKYELIGSTQVDLSGYAKQEDILASKIIDKYVLTKDFRTALNDDQDFLQAIKRDIFTLVIFDGSTRDELMEQAGFESILYYKGQTIGICLIPTGDVISPDFVKQNQFKPNETYITSDLMKDYNQVIQEQFVELQSSLKQYVKNCLNRKLNVADIREFTQQELEEAFR